MCLRSVGAGVEIQCSRLPSLDVGLGIFPPSPSYVSIFNSQLVAFFFFLLLILSDYLLCRQGLPSAGSA